MKCVINFMQISYKIHTFSINNYYNYETLTFHTKKFFHRNSIAYSCKRFIHEFYMESFSSLQMYESLTFYAFFKNFHAQKT